MAAAATFSSRCFTRDVPGMGSITGERRSSHAIALCETVALCARATAAIAGLSANSVDGAGAFSYPLIFFPFISSAFVPTKTMPPVVRAFADHQPVTAIVDAIRALLSGQPVGNDIWIALAWCIGIMLVAYVFAMQAYKKRV